MFSISAETIPEIPEGVSTKGTPKIGFNAQKSTFSEAVSVFNQLAASMVKRLHVFKSRRTKEARGTGTRHTLASEVEEVKVVWVAASLLLLLYLSLSLALLRRHPRASAHAFSRSNDISLHVSRHGGQGDLEVGKLKISL